MNLRATLGLVGALLLSACGFSPIYGDHGGATLPVKEALNNIAIDGIDGRDGQFLRNKLIDRMYFSGRPVAPKARLAVHLHITETGLAMQKDATTTRSQIAVSASFKLVDDAGKSLLSGSAHSVASYGKLSAQYGTLATQRGAYERALNEIGEQIVGRLSVYYAEKDVSEGTKAP